MEKEIDSYDGLGNFETWWASYYIDIYEECQNIAKYSSSPDDLKARFPKIVEIYDRRECWPDDNPADILYSGKINWERLFEYVRKQYPVELY